jgi:hypothetical protein
MRAISLFAIATTTFLGGCMVYDTPRGEGGYNGGVYRQDGPRGERDREGGDREMRRGDDRDDRRGDDRR